MQVMIMVCHTSPSLNNFLYLCTRTYALVFSNENGGSTSYSAFFFALAFHPLSFSFMVPVTANTPPITQTLLSCVCSPHTSPACLSSFHSLSFCSFSKLWNCCRVVDVKTAHTSCLFAWVPAAPEAPCSHRYCKASLSLSVGFNIQISYIRQGLVCWFASKIGSPTRAKIGSMPLLYRDATS